MSELRDRLEALAARGTRRGADDVLSAAQREAQTGASGVTDLDGDDASIGDDYLPLVTVEPGARQRHRRFGSFVAAAGIAALIGVGVLAVTAMFGSGGAGSPEGAVRQLADAISHKDALAAVDVLVPSEVRSLRQTVNDATQKAADLKIVDAASEPLAGVDLSVNDLQLSTETLADGYAKVTITGGDISASTHRAQMSALLQKAFRGVGGDAQGDVALSKLVASEDLPTFVVVVRQNGGWYVSPAYTAFEYTREINHDPEADFGSANAADLGSATPEGAVTDALHAAQAGNWDRLFALAPPDELPLYDYRAMLDKETASESQPSFTIDKLSTTSSVDGDDATVQLSASGTFGSDHEKWQVGGTCPSTEGSDVSSPLPASGEVKGPSGWCFSGSVAAALPLSLTLDPSAGAASSGTVSVSVVREDGRWFVSPVTTVLDVVDEAISHIDQRTVYSLLGLAYELPPDGTITLDQPFQVQSSKSLLSSEVYAFDGRAGQKVIGEFDSTGANEDSAFAFANVFTTDGREIGEVDFETLPGSAGFLGSIGPSVVLPSTGSYRLVLEGVGSVSGTSPTLTLWDLSHAPKNLRDAVAASDAQSGNETCTASPGLFGGESCSASFSSTPATSVTPATSSSGSSSSISGSATTSTTATTATKTATATTAP